MLTTTRRLAILAFVFLAWTPAAYAWSWPVQGPVLRPFAYDESQPASTGAASALPASKPAHSAPRRPRAATTRRSSAQSGRSRVRVHEHQRAQEPRWDSRTSRSPHRADVQPKRDAHPRASRNRVGERPSSLRRPFVEPAAYEARQSAYAPSPRREPSSPL